MPLYSYFCPNCEYDFDRIAKIESRDDQMCPDCGHRAVRGIDLPGMVWSPTRNGGHSL